jgi:hypothetical protein
VRWLIVAMLVAACHPGGEYVPLDRESQGVDRGETNGRTFDFVANKPDEKNDNKWEQWTIRLRGTAMWVSYSKDERDDKLGSISLTDKESDKIWKLVDALDLPNHKKGVADEDSGVVTMVLREPGEDKHDIHTVYFSRDTDEEEVIKLASYLRELVTKYKKETPNF